MQLLLAAVAVMVMSFAFAEQNRAIFEETPQVSSSWVQGQPAPEDTLLDLSILLEHPREEEFRQLVLDVSTPGHPKYGQFLSRHEIREYHLPLEDALGGVETWLTDNGVARDDYRLVYHGDQIDLKITVERANELFNTTFHVFTRNDQPAGIIRATKYSLPKELHGHIKTVVPIVHLPDLSVHARPVKSIVQVPQQPPSLAYDLLYCNSTIVPACLQGLYQLNNYSAPPNQGINLGVSGYLNQTFNVDDLHNFIAYYAPGVPQPFPQVVSTDGSALPDPALAGLSNTGEATLDLQYAAAVAPGIQLTYYTTSGVMPKVDPDVDNPTTMPTRNEPYLTQLNYLMSLPDDKLPQVLSTSYGENEQTVPGPYAYAVCQKMEQLASRGVSLIFSSGDEGCGSGCMRNDGTNRIMYNAIFPASCPFVTAVGGTVGVEPEVAAPFSSGGFSAYFYAMPWQNATLESYLAKLGNTNKGLFVWKGRGFPDVSVQAENYITRDYGFDRAISGTSAAAPVFAAMIANLNALRKSMGLKQLGCLNPWLYNNATSAFTDITVGRSTGCTGQSSVSGSQGAYIPNAGWDAVEGWDPVTGLGTPIWPKLVDVATKSFWNQPPSNPNSVGTALDTGLLEDKTFQSKN